MGDADVEMLEQNSSSTLVKDKKRFEVKKVLLLLRQYNYIHLLI